MDNESITSNMMNTMDYLPSSGSSQSLNSSGPTGPPIQTTTETRASPRNSRFEIQFDPLQSDSKLNSPITARLMYYRNPSTSKLKSYSHSTNTSPIQSPRNSYVQPFLPSNNNSNNNNQTKATTSIQQARQPQPPPLLRTVSLPTLQNDPASPQISSNHKKGSASHSRKSSILTNCTHMDNNYNNDNTQRDRANSCVSCQNSIITISSDDSSPDQDSSFDGCKRHHHRRESIAIKFHNPININEGDENRPQQTNTGVFESLKNYELK